MLCAEDEALAQKGVQVPERLLYMKQTIGNACGTIAVLHSLCNNMDTVPQSALHEKGGTLGASSLHFDGSCNQACDAPAMFMQASQALCQSSAGPQRA
jgi:hypothetical protein